MAGSPDVSRSSNSSSQQSKAPNFSRPRPQSANCQPKLKYDHDNNSQVHTISAFHEPNRELPNEPRFSLDSEQTDSSRSQHSAASEFAWDGQAGELRSRRRPKKFDEQRFERNGRPAAGSTAASSEPSVTIGVPRSEAGSSTSSSKMPKIVKRVSFDQQSERMSVSTSGQWEDTASHHTVSESGDSGSFDEEEIHKLRKKGINPALYAEMKAARKDDVIMGLPLPEYPAQRLAGVKGIVSR